MTTFYEFIIIFSAIFIPKSETLKTISGFNYLASTLGCRDESKYENISRFKPKMSLFDTKIYQFYVNWKMIIFTTACFDKL